jgi:ElaA protein
VERDWHERSFADLKTAQLYAIMALRERVFVVEQNCVYQDADGLDLRSRHVWAEQDDKPLAYLRIVPAGAKYPEISIGRIVVAPEARRTGLGRELVRHGISAANGTHEAIRIGAQAHLEKFYEGFGFAIASSPYVEDGIPHIEMLRPAGS